MKACRAINDMMCTTLMKASFPRQSRFRGAVPPQFLALRFQSARTPLLATIAVDPGRHCSRDRYEQAVQIGWTPHQEGWEQRHRKKCAGTVRNFHLAYKLETDVLEIEIPEAVLPAIERASFWITLRNALVLGANLALETEESEIAGFERVDAEEEEHARIVKIVLYDDVPGGAGYVEPQSLNR